MEEEDFELNLESHAPRELPDLRRMLEDYNSMTSSEPVKKMIETIIEDMLDDHSPIKSYAKLFEESYMRDLIEDLRRLRTFPTKAQLGGDFTLYYDPNRFEFNYAYEYETMSYYPRVDMNRSSVVVFPFTEISERVASFIANISRTYETNNLDDELGKYKTGDGATRRFRVSIVSVGSAEQVSPDVQAIDFFDLHGYWGFLRTVTKAKTRNFSFEDAWSGPCSIDLGNTAEGDKSNSFSGIFRSQQKKQVVLVTGESIAISESGRQLFECTLGRIVALTLTSDWPRVKDFVLNVELGHQAYRDGVRVHLLDQTLEFVEKSWFYRNEIRPIKNSKPADKSPTFVNTPIQKVLLPVHFSEISEERTRAGVTSVALVQSSENKSEKAKSTTAIDNIPFANMKYYHQGRNLKSTEEDEGDDGANTDTGTKPAIRPVLHNTVTQRVRLNAAQATNKALELEILGADDLLVGSSHAPNAYCACYLIDTEGNRMGASPGDRLNVFKTSDGEWKTDVVENSHNPQWETRIMMQEDDEVGVSSNVSHVLIIFKDVQSKLRRPMHIGQVVVPIGCFLEGQAIPLTLPLEPSAKTPESLSISGQVHLSVRSIFVAKEASNQLKDEKGPLGNRSRVKSMYRARHVSNIGQTGSDSVLLSYSLKPAAVDALNVFWPFQVIGGGLGDAQGHIACHRDGLVIDLTPGSGGVLANCIEASSVATRASQREAVARQRTRSSSLSDSQLLNQGNKMIFTVQWENVESALAVTESSVILTLMLHQDMEAAGGRYRPLSSTKPDGSIKKVSQEIVLAPCPARSLQIGIVERKNSVPIRREMRSFQRVVAEERDQPRGQVEILDAARSFMKELSDMLSMEQMMYRRMIVEADVREPHVKVVEADVRSIAANTSRWGAARTDQAVRRASTKAASRELLPRITSPGTMGGYEECLASARLRLRASLYRVQLTELCKGLSGGSSGAHHVGHGSNHIQSQSSQSSSEKQAHKEYTKEAQTARLRKVPDFSVTGTQSLIDRRLEDIDFEVKDSTTSLTEELYLRHSLICDATTETLGNYVLCSLDADEGTVLRCIEEVIRGYYSSLRDSFDEYLSNPDSFKRTPGQEAKIMIMQLVVTQNLAFQEIVAGQLYYFGYRLTSPLRLLPIPFTPDDVVDWYKASLLQETQAWLGKTLSQVMSNKTNTHGLPWDVEEVGGKIISVVPETVLTQLNTYLKVVTSTGKRFARALDKEWRKYGREKRLKELTEGSDSDGDGEEEKTAKRNVMRERSSSGLEVQSFNYDVYISVTEAVMQCLVLLAGEYARTLKTKHWSKVLVDISGAVRAEGSHAEEEANFKFLVSLINDAHRVQRHEMHERALQNDPEILRSPGRIKVAEAFDKITDEAISNVVRIIFADVHDLIIDFPRLWVSDSEVCGKLAECMSSYFQVLKQDLEDGLLGEIVRSCASVIAGCFLHMIAERVSVGPRLSMPELHRLQDDVCDAQDFFDRALGRELAPTTLSEAKKNYVAIPQMRDLGHALDLLSSPYPQEKDTLEAIIKQIAYHHELSTASSLIEMAISLRPVDSASTKSSVGEELIEMANMVMLTTDATRASRPPTQQSRYHAMLAALIVEEEEVVVNLNQHKAKSSEGSGRVSSAFKKLRERVSDLGATKMGGTTPLKSKRQRLKVLQAMDLLNDQALSEYSERTLTDSSISTFSRDDTFTLLVSRIEVKNVKTKSLFSAPNPYVYIKVGKDRKAKTAVSYGASAGYAHYPKSVLTLEVPRKKLHDGFVEIAVYDKEPIRRKRLIGKVEVRLAGLELHRIQSWFALSGGEHEGAEVFAVLDKQEQKVT